MNVKEEDKLILVLKGFIENEFSPRKTKDYLSVEDVADKLRILGVENYIQDTRTIINKLFNDYGVLCRISNEFGTLGYRLFANKKGASSAPSLHVKNT